MADSPDHSHMPASPLPNTVQVPARSRFNFFQRILTLNPNRTLIHPARYSSPAPGLCCGSNELAGQGEGCAPLTPRANANTAHRAPVPAPSPSLSEGISKAGEWQREKRSVSSPDSFPQLISVCPRFCLLRTFTRLCRR